MPKRILVIGDLHAPFVHKNYLEHCKKAAKQYKTNHTIFIGDVLDNSAASYHESDPDGYSAGTELEKAIEELKKWHKAFPNAEVTTGNHDRIVARKIFSAGLSSRWMKKLTDVLEVPTWKFGTHFKHDGVEYTHGDKCVTARNMALKKAVNRVQGHRHNESYIWHNFSNWGMQVGTGVDVDSYAQTYANEATVMLSCGVVLEGKPHLIPM